MTMRLRRSLFALSLAAGCATIFPKATPIDLPDGSYTFLERPEGTSTTLSGTLQVRGDSVTLDAVPGPCVPRRTTEPRSFLFACGEFAISADRTTGVWRLAYTGTKTVRVAKTVCQVYETTKTGAQVCARQGTEYDDQLRPIRGTLRLYRTEPPRTAPPTGG